MQASLTFSQIVDAYESLKPIEARVVREHDRGALVTIGGHLAKLRSANSTKSYKIGQTIIVSVEAVDQQNRKLFVVETSKSQLKEVSDKNFEQQAGNLVLNETYDGMIANVVDYGLFVDLVQGVTGLVHLADLSWERLEKVNRKKYKPGQNIKVKLIGIDAQKKRLSLSVKTLIKDPLELFSGSQKLTPDRVYLGQIENIVDYGVFVAIVPGVSALLHVSNLFRGTPDVKKIPESVKDQLKKVHLLPVLVNGISSDTRRISAAMVGDIAVLEKLEGSPARGQEIAGTIEKIHFARVEVKLNDGLTGYVFFDDNNKLYSDLVFNVDLGENIQFKVLGVDLSSGELHLIPIFSEETEVNSEYDYLLENFVTSNSNRDFNVQMRIGNHYSVLSRHLMMLEGSRRHKIFDYIYHFGCVCGDETIQIFGLMHRASVEFRIGRAELAVSLIKVALAGAVRLRRKKLVRDIAAILRRNSDLIWSDDFKQ